MNQSRIHRTLLPVLLAILVSFPLFMHLERWSIRMWDESRLAVNALEMAESNNFLVTHYDGVPDMWNVKPPLMIWLQVVCMKLFGYNELAVRLPAALAGLATMVLLFVFFERAFARSDIGAMSVLTLVTVPGYVFYHVTRTGDYDSVLIFFMMLVLVGGFQWINTRKSGYLFLAATATACMGLTKGIQGFMIFPGMLLYFLIEKKVLWIIRQRKFWLAVMLAIGPIIAFYLLREQFNPGYLKTVWEQELGGRFMREEGAHMFNYNFYINQLFSRDFIPWIFISPVALIFGLAASDSKVRSVMQYVVVASLSYLIIISIAKTKLEWYPAPLFPMFSIIIGIGLAELFRSIKNKMALFKTPVGSVLWLSLILAVFVFPFKSKIDYVNNPRESERHNWWQHKVGECLRHLEGYEQLNISLIGYNSQAMFYIKANNAMGKNYSAYFTPDLPVGEHALLCQDSARKILDERFEYSEIEKCFHCEVVYINKPRE